MAIGPVISGGVAESSGGVPLDSGSTVVFTLGCDENGVYMVVPSEEGGSEE